MQQIKIHAFNTAYDNRVNTLVTSVYISEPFDQSSAPKSPPTNQFQAIWDTGATNTAITQKVVQTCGLEPTGMAKINTANGEMTKPTYLVSVWLPNKVCIPQLHVTETTIQGADVLLGMDVIGQGDFAVTNKDGKTNLSFRMPSIECIDFVKQQPTVIKSGNQPLHRVGRNDPCPCGSGRKYKKCHGQ